MNLIGKSTINPFLFYSGKVSGYFTWVMMILSISGIVSFPGFKILALNYISYFLCGTGLLLSIISMVNLGKSTRLGLPEEITAFKTGGLYKISRNPMYLGFDILTLSSIIYFMNPVIIITGIYSIYVYHLIIKSEEKFLEQRFGADYLAYKRNVRRYL